MKESRPQLLAILRYFSFSVFFLLFVLGPTFLTLGSILGATPLIEKKTTKYSDGEFYTGHF